MTTTRPPFTLPDLPGTVGLAAIGIFLGAGAAGAAVLLYQGTWVMLLLIIDVFIYQAIGQGIVHLFIWAIAALWATIRGRPVPQRPPSLPSNRTSAGPRPWIVQNVFRITFILSTLLFLYSAWQAGGFEDWGT